MQARKRAKLLKDPEKLATVRSKNRDRMRTVRLEASVGRHRTTYWETLASMYAADPVRTRKSGVLSSDLAVKTAYAVCAEQTKNRRRV